METCGRPDKRGWRSFPLSVATNQTICPQLEHLGCFEIFMTLRLAMVGIFLLYWLPGANTVSSLRLNTQLPVDEKLLQISLLEEAKTIA